MGEYTPNARFVLDDLAHVSDEALASRSRDPALLAMLWLLRDGWSPERMHASLPHWGPALARHLHEDGTAACAEALVEYALDRAAPHPQLALREIIAKNSPRAKESFMKHQETYGQMLRRQLRPQVEAEVRAELLAEGRAEQAAKAVLRVLAKRRVRVSKSVRARLAACTDLAELERMHDRALEVSRAEEIFSN
jgi:hypothetical protein